MEGTEACDLLCGVGWGGVVDWWGEKKKGGLRQDLISKWRREGGAGVEGKRKSVEGNQGKFGP